MNFHKSKHTAEDFIAVQGKKYLAIGNGKIFSHQDAVNVLGPENAEYPSGKKIWLFDYMNEMVSVEYNSQLNRVQVVTGKTEIGINFRSELIAEFSRINPKKWEEGMKAAKFAKIPGWKYDSSKLNENMFTGFSKFFNQSKPASIINDTNFQNNLYTMEISIWKYGNRGLSITIMKGDKPIWESKTANLNALRDTLSKAYHMLRSIGLTQEHVRTIKKLNGKVIDDIDDYNEEIELEEARRPGTFSRIAPDKRYGLNVGDQNDIGNGMIEIIIPRNNLEIRDKLLRPLLNNGYKFVNTVRNMKMDIVTLKKPKEIKEEVEELDEYVLNAQQRRKRGLIMKRFKNKIKLARERKAKRLATKDQLIIRARRMAIQMLRRRFAGKMGADYANLTVSQKIQVDKRIESKKKLVQKMALRILPKVRQKEILRYRSKNQHDAEVKASANQVKPEVNSSER